MNLNVTKAGARATVRKLLAVHDQTMRDIENGKKFWKGGEDVTSKIYARVREEIKQCRMVDDALDFMSKGELRRAASLCDAITEHLGDN